MKKGSYQVSGGTIHQVIQVIETTSRTIVVDVYTEVDPASLKKLEIYCI